MMQNRSRSSSAEIKSKPVLMEIGSVLSEATMRAPPPPLENEDLASSSIIVQPRPIKRKNPVDSNDDGDQPPKKKTTQHLTSVNDLSIGTPPSESISDSTISADVRKLIASLAEQKLLLRALKTDNTILKAHIISLTQSSEIGTKALTSLVKEGFRHHDKWLKLLTTDFLKMREELREDPIDLA